MFQQAGRKFERSAMEWECRGEHGMNKSTEA